MRRVRQRRGDRGATLVEFALILPLLMMLILGMFSGGIAYNRKNSMTNAVREGARYGATILDDASDPDDLSEAVRARVDDLAGSDLELGDICVGLYEIGNAVALDKAPNSCPASVGAVPADPSPASGCIVKVWAAKNAEIEMMITKFNVGLSADGRARYERTC